MNRILSLVLALSVVAVGLAACKESTVSPTATGTKGKAGIVLCPGQSACRHVYDMARALPPSDLPRFEQYMGAILLESGVDVRFAFVPDTGGRSIE